MKKIPFKWSLFHGAGRESDRSRRSLLRTHGSQRFLFHRNAALLHRNLPVSDPSPVRFPFLINSEERISQRDILSSGAGNGNRTRFSSLGRTYSTSELYPLELLIRHFYFTRNFFSTKSLASIVEKGVISNPTNRSVIAKMQIISCR